MLLNLKALNESFEKKYTLNENSSPYMVEFTYGRYYDSTDTYDGNLRGHLKVEADSPEQAIEAAKQYCKHYDYYGGENFGNFRMSPDNFTNVDIINAHELLGESLTESAKLNEKFSDSMPSWLKKRLGYTIGYNDAQTSGGWQTRSSRVNKVQNKYPNFSRPQAQKQRGGVSRESSYALGPQFLEAGVDLNKVEVVEAPVPSKVPRATKNQQFIPIFAFANGQVWAKGINDRELANYDAIPGHGGEAFSKIPNSEIINNAVAYAYIDLSAKGATDKIRKQRADLKAELEAIPEISRGVSGSDAYVSSDSKGRSIGQWVNRDKSGYLKINAARYANVAKELAKNKKYRRLPTLLDECTEKFDYYKHQLNMIFDEIDLTDSDLSAQTEILSLVQSQIYRLKDASEYFIRMKDNLDSIEDLSNLTSRDDQQRADYALRFAEFCYEELDRIESNMGHLFKEVADW